MSGYRFSRPERFNRSAMADGTWVRVDGGGLPSPVELRISRSSDGRRIVTGLVLVDDREITAQTLRSIRHAEILAELFDRAADPDDLGQMIRLGVWRGVLGVELDATAPVPVRSRQPPDESYRAFAHTYRREWARNPHRAMTAAARALGLSRATANRWAAECRRLGYLPAKEGEQ